MRFAGDEPLNARDIVVVEDDDATRDLLSIQCQGAGWVVAAFPDAQAAVEWGGWEDADVLVADYNLPGMTGAQLVAWVRRVWPHVHTILTSAVNPDADAQASAHVYIDKLALSDTLGDVLEALRAPR